MSDNQKSQKTTYELRLYITEETSKTKEMIKDLREILTQELDNNYELKVINIMERPELAEEEKILATPMLEKKLPSPVRRIVGDLSDKEGVLVGLDLVNK